MATTKRYDVMYNDFVIVGPKADPAKIAGEKDVADALRKIAAAKAVAKTADDHYAIGRLELNAAADSNDNEAAATESTPEPV